MVQEPTLQTVIDLIKENKKDTDQKFASIDQKFEGLTEIMIKNFDRLEKKIDDVRTELKQDIQAVVRVSNLMKIER